jgi:ABC-2 type transport system ATP-binding protein
VLRGVGHGEPAVDPDTRRITVGARGIATLTQAVQRLDDASVDLADITLVRPTLDDVFLSLTGHADDTRPRSST